MKAGQKDSPLKRGLRTIANILIPMIPRHHRCRSLQRYRQPAGPDLRQ